MTQDLIGHLVDPKDRYGRFVMATFGVCFQLAEILLVVGAFRYAGERTGSLLLTYIGGLLGFVGSLWLGLLIPGIIGRLKFWERTNSWVRYFFAIAVIYASSYGAHLYLQAIAAIAKAQASLGP